jgi:NAD(P)-dependent dehydrogenase (short-subunit alcohol dehydrogenase family)/catechol 2,3-dioxygenase-like lactoylglutathione lyase family enzyme
MPTAIITGASRGLGYALTEQLVTAGWQVIIDARGEDALRDAATALTAATTRTAATSQIEAIAGDITSATHRADLIRAAERHGRLDLLINNAGILGPSPLPSTEALTAEALRDIFEVNVLAPLALTQAALPLLRASHGIVADVTSDAAVEGYPGWGGYGAAKAATEQLRNVLAAEEETGVTVWRVDPGDLRTEMHQLAFPGEDISDRPLPEAVAPGLLAMLARRPASGRYKLADFAAAPEASATEVSAAEVSAAEASAAEVSAPIALWLTMDVADLDPATAFYRDTLALPQIDAWANDEEAGAVFAVGPAARIEVERSGGASSGARAAIEYPSLDALTAAHRRIDERGAGQPTPVIEHHRGHSGFTVHDPRGTEIYLWSEK